MIILIQNVPTSFRLSVCTSFSSVFIWEIWENFEENIWLIRRKFYGNSRKILKKSEIKFNGNSNYVWAEILRKIEKTSRKFSKMNAYIRRRYRKNLRENYGKCLEKILERFWRIWRKTEEINGKNFRKFEKNLNGTHAKFINRNLRDISRKYEKFFFGIFDWTKKIRGTVK